MSLSSRVFPQIALKSSTKLPVAIANPEPIITPKVNYRRRQISLEDLYRSFIQVRKVRSPFVLFCPEIRQIREQEKVENYIHNALRKHFPDLGLVFLILFKDPIIDEKVIVIKKRPKSGKLEYYEIMTSDIQ